MPGSCLAYCLTVDSSLPALTFQRYLRSITSSTAILTSAAFTSVAYPRSHFRDVLTLLHTAIEPMHLGFACQFQIQALWTNAYLSPAEVHRMVPAIKSIKKVSGEAFLTRALGRLRTQLREADYLEGGNREAVSILNQLRDSSLHNLEENLTSSASRDEVLVHRVVITPTGMYL